MDRSLLQALQYLRERGYQPTYNGRPSCPFCYNFIDYEETHAKNCVLLQLPEDEEPEDEELHISPAEYLGER